MLDILPISRIQKNHTFVDCLLEGVVSFICSGWGFPQLCTAWDFLLYLRYDYTNVKVEDQDAVRLMPSTDTALKSGTE